MEQKYHSLSTKIYIFVVSRHHFYGKFVHSISWKSMKAIGASLYKSGDF